MNAFWEAVSLSENSTNPQTLRWFLSYDPDTKDAIGFYTGEKPTSNSIEVTREEYETLRVEYIRVVDGEIKPKKLTKEVQLQLVKTLNGPFKTINDAMIFIADSDSENFDTWGRAKFDDD